MTYFQASVSWLVCLSSRQPFVLAGRSGVGRLLSVGKPLSFSRVSVDFSEPALFGFLPPCFLWTYDLILEHLRNSCWPPLILKHVNPWNPPGWSSFRGCLCVGPSKHFNKAGEYSRVLVKTRVNTRKEGGSSPLSDCPQLQF